MAKIDVSFAALHSALFFGGKSFGLKLDSGMHGGLKMVYDQDEKELIVSWAGKTAHVPVANIASYTPGTVSDRKLVTMSHPMVAGVSATAQVETPMGHVHAGPGKGKTK